MVGSKFLMTLEGKMELAHIAISHQNYYTLATVEDHSNKKKEKGKTAQVCAKDGMREERKLENSLNREEKKETRMMGSGCLKNSQAYGEAWYWDQRYNQETGPFDWYQKYPSLAPLLHLYIPSHHRVLVVGAGNSAFSEGMVNDGYSEVFNIDISSVVIEAMQKKYSSSPQMKYMKMDVRDMTAFESGSFDAIIDKGTLDSLLCGHNSRENAAKMLKEVGRVLKDRGIYLLVTYGAPNYRMHLLRNSGSWTIKLHVIDRLLSDEISEFRTWNLTRPVPLDDDGISAETFLGKNPDVHYIYVCTKNESGEQNKEHEFNG